MILSAALAIADNCSMIVNSKCFAGRGAVKRPKGGDRLVPGKSEGQKISVPVLAVADDLAVIVDGASRIDLPAQ